MDYKQYYADLAAGKLPNLLLFDGEEEYVKESASPCCPRDWRS